MKKEDMRTKRTKKALKKAITNLLEKEGIDNISVTDICKEAEVNRVTFYTHYTDKYDLLKDQIRDILKYMDQENRLYYEENKTGDIIKDYAHTVSHSVYKTCVFYKKFVHSLTKKENSFFYKMLEDFIIEQGMKSFSYVESKKLLKYPPKFIIHFFIGGFSKIIIEYSLNENSLSEHEFFLYFDKLFYSLLKSDIFITHTEIK